ncbi:MAG: putative toxin-antitoxin system toxin component, PIN family [Sphingomonadaceae bacterium]
MKSVAKSTPTAPSNAVRLVADTNTVISGLLWGGTPGRLMDLAVQGRIKFVTSLPLLAELEGVLARDKFSAQLAKRGLSVADVFDGYVALVETVAPAQIAPTITRDPADDQVLAAALAGKVDLIVSGDAHLLDLKLFRGIEIVTTAAALEIIA